MLNQTKRKALSEDIWAYLIMGVSSIYLFTISFLSEGLYGDSDSIAHYNLARYAFKYPENLVHHWGKPLYTTLCAPFAQLGFQGAITFNILCGLLTSLLVYRIVKLLQYRNAILVVPFALFTPIYMVTMMTGLTEILFSLVLTAGIYFYLKQKSILSAIIISFIPYARTEGVMFLVIFFIAFLLVKKYKAIPFLITGFVVYSVAGYFHYNDLLWFFTALPYSEKGSQLYGSGSFWFYTGRFPKMMGYPLLILALTGLVIMILRIFRDKKPKLEFNWISEYYLATGSFFAFLFVHSFLWWQGMMGVLSSERFMACIMPIGAIFALSGFNGLIKYFKGKRGVEISLIIVILGLVLWMPYYFYDIPALLVRQDKVMKETADAVRKLGYKDRKVLFFDPKFAFYLGEDPYDRSKLFFRLTDDKKPETNQPDGTLLVWDAYFAEVEKRLILDDLVRNTNFKLIDGFIPEKDFNFAGKQNYVSLIFQKNTSDTNQNEWILLDSTDYENAPKVEKEPFLSDSVAFTGQKSVKLSPKCIYSFAMEKKLSDFQASEKVIARVRAKIFNPGRAKDENIILVISVHDEKGETTRYLTKAASYYKPSPGKWFEMSIITPLYLDIPENGKIKLYIWYTGREEIFADDLILEYIPVYE